MWDQKYLSDFFPWLSLIIKVRTRIGEKFCTPKNFHLKKKKSIGYHEGIDNGPVIKLSIITALRRCLFPNRTVCAYGCGTRSLPSQVQWNDPACMSHVCRSSHGAPCLIWLYEHSMLHTQ